MSSTSTPTASRGLPGFLRRSLRLTSDVGSNNDEDDDDDDDNTNINATATNSSNHNNNNNKSHSGHEHNTNTHSISTATPDSNRNNKEEDQWNHSSNSVHQNSDRNINKPSSSSSHDNNNSSSHSLSNITKTLSDSWEQISVHEQQQLDESDSTTSTRIPPRKEKSYKEKQYEKILFNTNVINMIELRKLTWNGIPNIYRSKSWKILLGYLPTNCSRHPSTIIKKQNEYNDAITQYYNILDHNRTIQEQETLRQILVDVPRTQPSIALFRNERIQRSIVRLLYIWAIKHPASSYVQGMNDLVTPLYVVFLTDYFCSSSTGNDTNSDINSYNFDDQSTSSSSSSLSFYNTVLDGHIMNHCSDDRIYNVEVDVYWCLTNILDHIQDHYTNDQPGLQRMVYKLEELVYRIDKDLTIHIRDTIGIQFLQFSFKWMNCLLLREFHLSCIIRLWDTYFSEEKHYGFEEFHIYVCAAFMCQFSTQLQEMNFDELFQFMQSIPTTNWTEIEIEVLLSQAYVLSTLFKGSDAHLNK